MKLPEEFGQIIRLDGKDVFVEVLGSGFHIGKVYMQFIKYDKTAKAGSKFVNTIKIYMDMDKFLVLCQDVKTGRIPMIAKQALDKATAEDKKFANYIYQDMGGISAKTLKARGQERPDGKCLSRQFKITPSFNKKFPWVLSGETGPGTETDTGLISPDYGFNPEEIVRVAMSDDDFKKLILITEAHIHAYISSQYFVQAVGMNKEEKKVQGAG